MWIALVCLGLGENERAISYLEQAVNERETLAFLIALFIFDPLRSDPRFQSLLKKMNFPAAPAG